MIIIIIISLTHSIILYYSELLYTAAVIRIYLSSSHSPVNSEGVVIFYNSSSVYFEIILQPKTDKSTEGLTITVLLFFPLLSDGLSELGDLGLQLLHSPLALLHSHTRTLEGKRSRCLEG